MKIAKLVLCLIFLPIAAIPQEKPISIQAGTLLDGRGSVLHNVRIVIQNRKILRVEEARANANVTPTYNFDGLTVLPGWIDVHVHITWHFGPNGKAEDKNEMPEAATLAAAGNAWTTLMAGFTTIQSLGAPEDKDLRDAIARGEIPGPRIITALNPIDDPKLTPEQIRESVRKLKADGADVVKIFASKSIRDGGGQTLSDEQLAAACGEAKAQGLRAVVHAYRSAIRAATLAGCSEIEHGTYATDDDLRLMAEHGTFFDPQIGLVIHNYLDNKARFLGIGNYTEEGFAKMQEVLPLNQAMFKRALATKGLKIVFGTDAVAGAHGRNAEEFIYRAQDGQDSMDAMVAANSRAAESLNLQNEIGSIAAGMQADIIALDGDPLKDITAVRRVVFVMKAGTVYKNVVAVH
jgi:imidazolonepropionase-like amidohydrolase